jgi:tRNA (guanine37-N1)-methyltransferase
VRLLAGVLGNPASLRNDSHSPDLDRLLEGPSYTRPPCWRGLEVPGVLLSGDHARIAAWRREVSQQRTRERRPDLAGPDQEPE